MLKRLRVEGSKLPGTESPKKKAKEDDDQKPTTLATGGTPMSPQAVAAAQGHHASAIASSHPSPLPLKQTGPSKSKTNPSAEPRPSSEDQGAPSSRGALPTPPRVGGAKSDPDKAPSKQAGDIITTKVSIKNGATLGPESAVHGDDDASTWWSRSTTWNRWLSRLAVPILLLSNLSLYCVWHDTAWELEAASYERDQAVRHVGVLKATVEHLSEALEAHRELLDHHQDVFDRAMEDMQAKLLEQEELIEEVQATCDALEEAIGEYDDDEHEADSRDYDD